VREHWGEKRKRTDTWKKRRDFKSAYTTLAKRAKEKERKRGGREREGEERKRREEGELLAAAGRVRRRTF